ncbi:MAG: deoxyhypusine synthase family protein [Candidatus Micrarchaeota archaeon]|nr:deoxyhypusine synthase family protein [Candidatus Micrarchaeota archaeon]
MPITDVDNLSDYLKNTVNIGLQATELGHAREILKLIHSKRNSFTNFLGFTANLLASGMRGYISKLIKDNFVDVVITTGGSVDHDIIKSFLPYEVGNFDLNDSELHEGGLNRIGNILVHNSRYEKLEQISNVVLEGLLKKDKFHLSPSELINEYAKFLYENSNDKCSFLRACYEKGTKVYCPGITDSAIGLNLYFFKTKKQNNSKLIIDVTKDMNELANKVLNSENTFALILGGGIAKHHILGVNLLRQGLDYGIYVTTSSEYDGSLSGARTREAISWGKLKHDSRKKHHINHVTIHSDVSIVLPLLLEGII